MFNRSKFKFLGEDEFDLDEEFSQSKSDEYDFKNNDDDDDDDDDDDAEDSDEILHDQNIKSHAFNSSSKAKEPLNDMNLKHINELPTQFRNIFSDYKSFNKVQSVIFDDVYLNDNNLVICAPTSSGKTVLFELAIVRLLVNQNYKSDGLFSSKIIYMAPLKALISEKSSEWKAKFENLHRLKCVELTGDNLLDNESDIVSAHIILTTPEKWDFVTRKFKNSNSFMKSVKLFMIDEIHVMGESSRGATIEAVISRMKLLSLTNTLRFIAVSATIPNINDFAEWLRENDGITNALVYNLDDEYRPVKVEKFVIGFKCPATMSDYCFDLSLNYKLADIIEQYSQSKPTLIFCSSRKGTSQAALVLAENSNKSYIKDTNHRKTLIDISMKIKDTQLRELIVQYGVGYHHAGLDKSDRSLVESLFLSCNLLVLFSTSTLSMGINLPAHLVIIKSTKFYATNQSYDYYSITQMQQMIGRAGRPQFDKTAKAIILTKESDRSKYMSFVEGKCFIESQLHKSLIEYINAEIVLKTIYDISSALNWLKSTYLWIRIRKNPSFYDLKSLNEKEINNHLLMLCEKDIKELINYKLIERSIDLRLSATDIGKLMAYYYVSFETMKQFIKIYDQEHLEQEKSLNDLILLIANCKELEDIKIRASEKAILNDLNNNGKVPKSKNAQMILKKNPNLIRFKFEGKVKTTQMKINVLIQAQFGTISINDFALQHDTLRIIRIGQRLSKCLLEYLMLKYNREKISSEHFGLDLNSSFKNYKTFVNAVVLHKCFTTQLWYDSPHIFKQFDRIGDVLSRTLVDANLITFEKLIQVNPDRLEVLLKKRPPFGNNLISAARKLPRFDIELSIPVQQKFKFIDESKKKIELVCKVTNIDVLSEQSKLFDLSTSLMFIVGDNKNNLIHFERFKLATFKSSNGICKKLFTFDKNLNDLTIYASLIVLDFVGLDVIKPFVIFEPEVSTTTNESKSIEALKTNESKSSKQPIAKKSKIAKEKSLVDDLLSNEEEESYLLKKNYQDFILLSDTNDDADYEIRKNSKFDALNDLETDLDQIDDNDNENDYETDDYPNRLAMRFDVTRQEDASSQSDTEEPFKKAFCSLKRGFNRSNGSNKRSSSLVVAKKDKCSLVETKLTMFNKMRQKRQTLNRIPDPSQPKITDSFVIKKGEMRSFHFKNESKFEYKKSSNKENEIVIKDAKSTQMTAKEIYNTAEKEVAKKASNKIDDKRNFDLMATLDDLFGKESEECLNELNQEQEREKLVLRELEIENVGDRTLKSSFKDEIQEEKDSSTVKIANLKMPSLITDDYLKQKLLSWAKQKIK